jgi:hypothetical protein
MKKKLPCSTSCRDITAIPDTKYVILPDGKTVARLLKSREVSGKTYYNLVIDGEVKSVSVERLADLAAGIKPSSDDATPPAV